MISICEDDIVQFKLDKISETTRTKLSKKEILKGVEKDISIIDHHLHEISNDK